MAAANLPKWGFGQSPMKIQPVSTSFVPFFSSAQTGTEATNMSWSTDLAAPTPISRLPAWSRIPIQRHASTGQTGQIMKRVGLCTRRRHLDSVVTKTFKTPAPEPEPAADEFTLEEESRRIRHRSVDFKPVEGDVDFEGQPCSEAELANLWMLAKVDVTNYYMTTSTETHLADKIAARRGELVQVVPMKRYAGVDTIDIPVSLVPNGGNKLNVYHQLLPIIERAMINGDGQVSLKTASIAEALYIMRQTQRNVRKPVSAGPRLSDVTDYTEPPTPTAILRPVIHAEARSPQKRIARLTSPIKKSMRLLTNSVYKLVPGSSPKASPSPTKSDSAPSTPIQQSPNPAKPAITPRGIDSTPLTQSAETFEDVSIEHLTHARPVAPTPSRWSRRDPSTPQAFSPVRPMRAPATPIQTDSPIGLAALLPPTTPQLPQFELTPQSTELATFDFGTVSPAFNSSISWMNTSVQASEPKRIKNVNKARRRQSEPLLRKYLKAKARRASSSPQKVRFQEQDIFRDDISIGSLFDSVTSTPAKPTPTDIDAAQPSAVEEASELETTMDIVTAAELSVVEEVTEPVSALDVARTAELSVVGEATEPEPTMDADTVTEPATHPTPTATIEHGVVNIDMRQNPDIFGTHVSSPPAPVYSLSRMADDRCQGHAKVVVTEQNGRLFVRFKLSAEYAHMFPASQGFDGSQFSMSPSISSSPRITFKSPAVNQAPTIDSVLETPHISATPSFHTPELPPGDNTLLFRSPQNGFTPTEHTNIGGTPGVNTLLRTPDVTGFSVIKDQNEFQTPELPAGDNTLLFRSPQNGLTPVDNTNIGGTPGVNTLLQTPNVTEFSALNEGTKFQTPELPAGENTLLFGAHDELSLANHTAVLGTPGVNTLLKTPDVTGLGISNNINSTPAIDTPKVTGADDTLVMSWDDLAATTPAPKAKATSSEATPVQMNADRTLAVSWDDLAETTPVPKIKPTPPSDATPVQTSPAETTPAETASAETAPAEVTTQPSDALQVKTTPDTTPAQEEAPAQTADTRRHDYDSPGREYMREFIKRSRQSIATTTTETGSPMASIAKRQPLEARSPNRGSPQKNKRKHDDDSGEVQSPAKKVKPSKEESKQTTPKRARRTKTTRQKTDLATEMTDLPTDAEEATAEVTETVEEQTEVAEDEGPVTRRSTRLRSREQTSGAPKSSIPTPIKLNRSGAGRNGGAVLNSSVRSEQQDLTHQTRLNTKRNKGSAEYPAQVLAKHAETKGEDDSDASRASGESSACKGKKSVVWREPLESVQEAKPKKGGRPTKAKVTQGKTGVAKPKSTAQKKRAVKAAEDLGMVGNGTPVKPQRVTRARTRSQS
ncbi:uncharacterized protein NECHADRAFT_75689 [Fusarium vanettenii 77-13-4]|uniref:Uncharacterized protein n=1 Tax=Fusarium vanettenii (strain ATCC MYA-4622 / CBS 123669 / FGSC 9596 / NRRL 45880 / 77-13-4) TaxID=660122 RepID=C7YJI4_FUSV7|nr:uncharacterized protein NECHADRAFT_75689 [Fusarium vanettenii 77-13-4]EEU48979.1 hypothetical protein NECHADRAFT_75689 [Fusarium vanettenii 77-13-4]